MFSLDKIARLICKEYCKEPYYYDAGLYEQIKTFLRKNGRPAGCGKLTYDQARELFDKYERIYPHDYVKKS